MEEKKPWFQETWAIVLGLLIFFPVGIFLMWRYAGWGSRTKWIVTAAFGAFLVLVVVGSAVGGDGTEDEPLAERKATGTPRAPSPTTTAPTAAPLETPTATIPIPTEFPAFTISECAYVIGFIDKSQTIGDALNSLSDLLLSVGDDVTLIFDSDWIIDTATQMAVIQVAIDEFNALQVPASMQEIHTTASQGLGKLDSAMDLLATGIDNLDPDSILAAADLMTVGTEDINNVVPLVEAFGEQRSGTC